VIRRLRGLFAWRRAFDAGVWAYFENTVTGQRKAVRRFSGGYSPQDAEWLSGGLRT
jgi:hypothetical protein